ncbi:MAG: hypothetical protein HA496_02225 [Thaumarchaeota archaeon]|nr:hypothetical protein [Nitrososphaerota archaeon]
MISDKEALDIATKIGVQAKFDGLTKSQFENLLSSLDYVQDPKASLLVAAAFAYRQTSRLGKGKRTADLVANALERIYREGGKEDARKLLGLAKWIFEIVEKTRLERTPNEFTDLLRMLAGVRAT